MIIIDDLEMRQDLRAKDQRKVRGGYRIFESHVLARLPRGGVKVAGEIFDRRAEDNPFGW